MEVKHLTDRDLWDQSCMTRQQLATWKDSDYRVHEEGTRNTIKTLMAWHDLATTARPIAEYHEDMGTVLWWKFPIDEPPYVGSPNDVGFELLLVTGLHRVGGKVQPDQGTPNQRFHVGGWPGYHTHFTPIPIPQEPK